MKDNILIQETNNILWHLPKFIRRMFIKTYYNQGGVYINMSTIKWLEELKIEAFSEKSANKLSWDYFNKKYPQYAHKINLF